MRTLFRVGAILFYKDKLVTTKMKKGDKIYHVVPGGGVESEEDLIAALKRELKEELNIELQESKLVAIRELNITNHGRGAEFYFHVTKYNGIPEKGYDPEEKEAKLEEVNFLDKPIIENLVPSQLKDFINSDYSLSEVKHLGLHDYP